MKACTRYYFIMTIVWVFASHTGHAGPLFVKLGMVDPFPSDQPTAQSLQVFQEALHANLGSQLTLQIFPDEQLGSALQMMEGLQFGNIEMGILPAELLISRLPILSSITMPYIFRDNAHRFRVLDGPIGKQILTTLEELNLLGLGFLDTGMKGFLSKTSPLSSPGDFQGQHIGIIRFCSEPDCQNIIHQLSAHHVKALGAVEEIVHDEKIAAAWQAGTMNGIEYTPLQQIVPHLATSDTLHLTMTAHTTLPDVIIVSKRWFDSLEPQIQQHLIKASSLMARDQQERFANAQRQEFATLQSQGVILHTNRVYEGFWDAVQPVYQFMREQADTEFTSILERIQAVH